MSLFEDTNPRELKELLRQIHSREAALPDFQRDFVWDPNATQELIVSIASNYPAGSLLRIRNTHDLFACREFQDAPALNGNRPTYLVLDGQQRLTSLYQAFYGVGEHRYYLNLRLLLEDREFEECIFHLRANAKKAKEYDDPERQADELIMPLGILKGGTGNFGDWAWAIEKQATTLEERNEIGDALRKIRNQWIQAIDDYKFPVVTLSDQTSAEAVCTIFETLNRTGVKLSPFELLTARFWPKHVNLRKLWADALEREPIIADFEVDPYYVLQILSLAARATPSCKRSDVLNLSAGDIQAWWDRSIWGLAKGLEIIRDDCGVLIPKWLPYYTLLIPLAAVLAKLGLPGTPEAGANRQKLVRWFWCASLGQAYENAPNSQAAKDMAELRGWLQGSAPPETVSGFRFDPRILRDTTSRQRALYRSIIALVLRKDSRDFHTGQKLTGDLIVEHHVDDHHIFPAGFLKSSVTARLRDCVLNRTLIDRKTNIRISNRAPADYMTEIQSARGPEGFRILLASHLLPAGPASPFWQNHFEAFLTWRQDAIWSEIKALTGTSEAADMLTEEMSA